MTSVNEAAGLNDRVATLMTETLRVCTEAGVADLADRIKAEVALWAGRNTTLVVAGETNRGKSALINALVGADVLPADSTRATATYVVVHQGEEESARVFLDSREEPLTMSPAEAARWILTGVRVGDDVSVRAVDMSIRSPFLDAGLSIVDTPGAGGLDAAQARVTLATLARADALLFVLDPNAPISEPELAFLRRASERIDTVIFVLTKTDAYRGWRDIEGDDGRLIAAHAPRFAGLEIMPTSARLKRTADELATAGTPDPELVDESGIPALARAIDERVRGRGALLRLANLLRLGGHALDRLELSPRAITEATADGDAPAEAVEHAQNALEDFRDIAERTQVQVSDRFNQLRDTVVALAARQLRELADRYEATGAQQPKDSAPFVEAVETDVHAVDLELTNFVQQEVATIVGEACANLDAPPVALNWDPALEDTQVRELLEHGAPKSAGDPSLRMRVATAFMSASTSGTLAYNYYEGGKSSIGLLMGTGAILGVLTTVTSVRFGRKQREAQALRVNVRGALDNVRGELTPMLRQRVLVAQRQVEAALRSHVRHTTRDRQAAVAECQQLARADVAARQKARTDAERRLAQLAHLRASADNLAVEVEQRRRGLQANAPRTPEVIL